MNNDWKYWIDFNDAHQCKWAVNYLIKKNFPLNPEAPHSEQLSTVQLTWNDVMVKENFIKKMKSAWATAKSLKKKSIHNTTLALTKEGKKQLDKLAKDLSITNTELVESLIYQKYDNLKNEKLNKAKKDAEKKETIKIARMNVKMGLAGFPPSREVRLLQNKVKQLETKVSELESIADKQLKKICDYTIKLDDLEESGTPLNEEQSEYSQTMYEELKKIKL